MGRTFLVNIASIACLTILAGLATGQDVQSPELRKLFEESWETDLREDPLFATRVGDQRYNGQLPSNSLADVHRRFELKRSFVDRARAIDRDQLSPADRIHYDIFLRLMQDDVTENEFESYLIPITNRSGFHVEFPELPRLVPLNTVEDYQNYIARLQAFGRYVDNHIELLKAGVERGMVLPAAVLEGYRDSIVPHIVDDPMQSLLYAPFKSFPERIETADRQRLETAGREAITSSVVSGYRRFLEFMDAQYVPNARGSIGAAALPRGRDFYRHRVRQFTTLDLTPEQVHELGMAEVNRIHQEMIAVPNRIGFEGDYAAFLQHLRTSPQFYAETPEELLRHVSYVLKRMDGHLPTLFRKLPRTPYGIREIPDYIAPRTTTAYYMQPSGDGTRAGFYFVNTFNLKSRPLYEIEALSLHEAVPGHHLQIALAMELEGTPQFRRYAEITAFVEGWALYSERLGLECGFYEDPISDFGRLSYEQWRACRLVVDTGMHYFGWTREQAIDFMAKYTALSQHNIEAEVDRYIAWPGQALAYKIGELKIRELRQMAEMQLGPKFDVREFHDIVLGSGAVPLGVLEENVRRWVDENKSQ